MVNTPPNWAHSKHCPANSKLEVNKVVTMEKETATDEWRERNIGSTLKLDGCALPSFHFHQRFVEIEKTDKWKLLYQPPSVLLLVLPLWLAGWRMGTSQTPHTVNGVIGKFSELPITGAGVNMKFPVFPIHLHISCLPLNWGIF